MGMFSKRYEESKSNTGSNGYLDFGSIGNVEFYKAPKGGAGAIDIVPYYIASDKHPAVGRKTPTAKIGDPDYGLDVWVHKNVGPVGIDCVCPALNYDKPCPICIRAEEIKAKKGRDDQEYINLRAKRRMIYHVLDATKDNTKTLLYEVSHYLFEKEILDEAVYAGEKKGLKILDFADPDDGYTIEFRTSVSKFNGGDKIDFKNISFAKREPGIVTTKMMKSVAPLDSLLILRSYKEIESILYGETDPEVADSPRSHRQEEVVEEAPRSRRSRVEEEVTEETPRSRRSSRTEDNEEAPRSRKTYREPEEEEVADAPRSRREAVEPEEDERPKKGAECPYGHEFGTDNDQHKDCDDCEVWEKCRTASKSR